MLKHKTKRIIFCLIIGIVQLSFFMNCSAPKSYEAIIAPQTPNNKQDNSSIIDPTPAPVKDCIVGAMTIKNNETKEMFLNSSVPFGDSCKSEIRICKDGVLSGSYNFTSCSISAAAACLFNGLTIKHGETTVAYLNSAPPFGTNCVSENRVCNNGKLSGSYTFGNCKEGQPASCLFNGQTISHGQSIIAFESSSVSFGQSCNQQTRTCSNGSLSGSFLFANCSVGAAAACLFNGVTVAHNQTVKAFQKNIVEYGLNCLSEDRLCNNGSLSGTYGYSSCTVSAPPPPPPPAGSLSAKFILTTEDKVTAGPGFIATPDNKPDLRIDLENLKRNINGIRIEGSSGDTWLWPGSTSLWFALGVETTQGVSLYFGKNADNTSFRVTIQYDDNTLDSVVINSNNSPVTTNPFTNPIAAIPATKQIPLEILNVINGMWKNGNGLVIGVKVGTKWLHGAKHVQDAWGNGSPARTELYGDQTISYYNDSFASDPIAIELPPPGTRIWQVKIGTDIVRTSRIGWLTGVYASTTTAYYSFNARLSADGPYPGVPIGGDSGSIAFYRDQKGLIKVLGTIGYAGMSNVAVPAQWPSSFTDFLNIRPNLIFKGTIGSPQSIYPDDKGTDWYEGMSKPPVPILKPRL